MTVYMTSAHGYGCCIYYVYVRKIMSLLVNGLPTNSRPYSIWAGYAAAAAAAAVGL
jgi:hypothetical protein